MAEKSRRRKRNRNVESETARVVQPGYVGGSYRPLNDRDIERIHSTALDVLENIGVAEPIPILEERALASGCWLDEDNRLHFPRALVEDVIARAGRDFGFYARDPRHDLDLSGGRVHLFGGGEAVTALDVGAQRYRPSTLLDVYDVSRLVDQLEHIHAHSRLIVPTEIEDLLAGDINTAYASLAATNKPLGLTFASAKHVAPTLKMLDMIAGGEGQFVKRPFCHTGGCTIISPLRYARDSCEVCIEGIGFNAPVWVVIAPQAGATAPAALAGALVQVIAETLASLLLIDLVKPGHPVFFGPWPFISDLRTGAFTGGSGEEALLNAASAQISKHYGFVNSVAAGMTDSKLPDNQAGYEKGISVVLAALAGTTDVSEAAGMLGSLMGCSYESLVIDNEMAGMIQRVLRGIEVTDETLSYEVIQNAVKGDGHFLRDPQTLALMRTEYLYPGLADRSSPEDWEERGSPDIRQIAGERVKELLSSHYPEYIDPIVDRKIREQFPILLPREAMRPDPARW